MSGTKLKFENYSETITNLTDGNRNTCEVFQGNHPKIFRFTKQHFVWRIEVVVNQANFSQPEGK